MLPGNIDPGLQITLYVLAYIIGAWITSVIVIRATRKRNKYVAITIRSFCYAFIFGPGLIVTGNADLDLPVPAPIPLAVALMYRLNPDDAFGNIGYGIVWWIIIFSYMLIRYWIAGRKPGKAAPAGAAHVAESREPTA
ncbi:hypothetical protein [Hufsiella ginkgonis]|uniref:Uncharacterized protein n=1 Tax=Hufsiella ginkgonis TaxID=2695274 RepID=A0A7K1Y1A4_9SPHI|nr:hypothetical protein [Hufsiella ginkgonis]MXV16799.1 hypothetical protein [Hufsiella ginkgonis]